MATKVVYTNVKGNVFTDGDMSDIKIRLPGQKANRIIPQRKLDYAAKFKELLDEYDQCLIVTVTNVGSKQIAEMRKDFRGRVRFLFGKNTLIRKVIRDYVKETGNAKLMALMDAIQGNCGMVFTKEAVGPMRKELIARKKQCAAKPGVISPVNVSVPAGPTGMEPTQTAMFQAMDIPTRINRGQIDIEEDVQVLFKDRKVGASEAALLNKLNIKPFYYGMKVKSIYENGQVIDASVLDITSAEIAAAFSAGLRQVAALCFSMNYPTIVGVPHTLLRAYKEALALGLVLETYSWEGLDTVKQILENPGAFAASSGAAASGAAGTGGAAAAEKEPTPEPSSSAAAPGGGMFGDDDSDSDSSS